MLKESKTTGPQEKFSKAKDYFLLIKFTLSFLVVFSSVFCYLLSPNVVRFDFIQVLLFFIAGMLVTGGANAINQAMENKTDAVMKRTANRPVAAGRMSQTEAYVFAGITGALGVVMLWYFFNYQSALLGLFSFFLYGFIYTPLKTVSSIAVLVGGVPGALPCLIGWVAGFSDGGNNTWAGGWVLFAMQFIWQFPHFWAIAWLAHQDYTKAGFKLLPSDKGPTKFTALQTVMYSTLMIPVGILPYYYNISGAASMWIIVGCNLWMLFVSVMLYVKMNAAAARKVMFSSYFYLMIIFLSLYADKTGT